MRKILPNEIDINEALGIFLIPKFEKYIVKLI
jgi:hypothetical protein